MKKTLIISSIVVGVILLGIFIALRNFAPYSIIQPLRNNESFSPDDYNLKYKPFVVNTRDNFELKCYHIQTDSAPRAVIILLHGIGGCKEHVLEYSRLLAENGIESIAFDGRAHGESGGEFCTYGYKERYDISEIVDIVEKQYPNTPIGIWGLSLGGAIAIQAMEIDDRLEFGVIECTFAELDQIVYDYQKMSVGKFAFRNVSDYVLYRGGKIADFKPEKVKPIESVKNIEQPVFMSHGDSDIHISPEYGKLLYKNLKSTDKEFYLIPEGTHLDWYPKGGEKYKQSLLNFIERNIE